LGLDGKKLKGGIIMMDPSLVNAGMKLREENHLSISRALVAPGDASLLPRAFVENSLLPEWEGTISLTYVVPSIGASFLENQLIISSAGGSREPIDNGYENFMYVIAGKADAVFDGAKQALDAEGYFWLPPGTAFEIKNPYGQDARILWVRKKYQPTKFYKVPEPIVSSLNSVPAVQKIAEIEQQCLPFETNLGFDMAMNMLSFKPGVTFPRVETHDFEHGGYFLDGRGNFWINGRNFEIHEEDFCYMAPYTPHYVVAYGPGTLRYLLYKNVNRDYSL
jgi:(S)-ureidoglycine aminohydrolase